MLYSNYWLIKLKLSGYSSKIIVLLLAYLEGNAIFPFIYLILFAIFVKSVNLSWIIFSSSSFNLVVTKSDYFSHLSTYLRFSYESKSCCSTWAYLSLISHIWRKIMVVFYINIISLFRIELYFSQGGIYNKEFVCRKWKNSIRSAEKLLKLKLFSYYFKNSYETVGELKKSSNFSSRF